MKIYGLPPGHDKFSSAGTRKTDVRETVERIVRDDRVNIDGSDLGQIDLSSLTAGADAGPRADRISEVSRRMSEGAYDRPDMTARIAAGILRDQVAVPATGTMEDRGESGVVARIGARLDNAYYDRPDVTLDIAGKLVSIVLPEGLRWE